jgi:hypothetical protein
VTISGKQVAGPVTVQLVACGSAMVRLLDAEGKPRAHFSPSLDLMVRPGPHPFDRAAQAKGLLTGDSDLLGNVDRHNYRNQPRTDAEGRCTWPVLIPGATYCLLDMEPGVSLTKHEFTVEASKMTDLGDITLKAGD